MTSSMITNKTTPEPKPETETERPSSLTVVVPTKNAGRTIEACLVSIINQSLSGVLDKIELVVVDNHSTDSTQDIAAEYADKVIVAGPERSTQRNLGLAASTSDFVAFIDADMVLTPDVCHQAIKALLAGTQAVVVPEESFGEGFFARCRKLEKELYLNNPDVEAARFFPISLARSIGGYREDLIAGEDWDFSDRMQAAGATLGRTEAFIRHDDGHISLWDTFKKKQYYGKTFQHYLRTRPDPSQRRMTRPAIFPVLRKLGRDPMVGSGLIVLKVTEVSGLVVGAWTGRIQSNGVQVDQVRPGQVQAGRTSQAR